MTRRKLNGSGPKCSCPHHGHDVRRYAVNRSDKYGNRLVMRDVGHGIITMCSVLKSSCHQRAHDQQERDPKTEAVRVNDPVMRVHRRTLMSSFGGV